MPQSEPRRRPWLLFATLLWLATLVALHRLEVRREGPSEDVQALVDSARLRAKHASATYSIRVGELEVGRLSSTVSGGQREEQLLYRLAGRLSQPVAAKIDGFVLADWDRRPERFVIEAASGGQRHRVEGGLRPSPAGGVLFEARYLAPAQAAERRVDLVLPEAPRLAPGPLPVPELARSPPGTLRQGALADPFTGEPVTWRVESEELVELEVMGESRRAVKHVLFYDAWTAALWTEPSGFPLRLELPLGLLVVLAEESR